MTVRAAKQSESALVVLLVIALAAAVGLGSEGTPVWALLRPGHAELGEVLTRLAIAGLAGGALVLAGVAGYRRRSRGRGSEADTLQATLARAAPAGVAGVVALALALIAGLDLGAPPAATARGGHLVGESDRTALPLNIDWWGSMVRAGDGEGPAATLQSDADQGTGIPLPVLLGVALFAVIGAALAWRRLAGGPSSSEEEASDPGEERREALHGAVIGTIEAMLRDPDPGTAIRGAYAKLLEGLAASGAQRFEYEGPVEHLRRVLRVLDVRPEPLRELIGLFEVARFSTHPLTSAHRERALGALRAVAGDLEVKLPVGAAS